jgi:hypothetical protein
MIDNLNRKQVQFSMKSGGLLKKYNTTACYGGTPCYYSYGPSCSAELCPLPVKCKTEIQTKIDDYIRTPVRSSTHLSLPSLSIVTSLSECRSKLTVRYSNDMLLSRC